MLPNVAIGQVNVQTDSEGVITISRGSTAILTHPDSITRISIADPEIADPVVIPPAQVLVNANTPGSTSLVIWGRNDVAQMYTIEVTADVASLQPAPALSTYQILKSSCLIPLTGLVEPKYILFPS